MDQLDGRRVLLVAPRFFGYYRDIRDEIVRRGARVDYLPDRPFNSPFMKGVTRLATSLVMPAASRLYEQMLADFGASNYDLILVVNGQTLSRGTLRLLRSRFPSARTVLYMWDSAENRRGIIECLPLYDAAFSFDPLSASQYGMKLRPLFYSRDFERKSDNDLEFHLSFVGTVHSDRFAVVDRLRRRLPQDLHCYWYLYLQAPWVFHTYRLAKKDMHQAKRDEFRFEPLTKKELQSILSLSRAVLDIEHPCQRGLTMRTFETLGSRKKLVTTNSEIRDYDFYDSRNICVVDRFAPQVPREFLLSPFAPIEPHIYHRYSLAGWLDEILQVESSSSVADIAPALA